MTDLKLNEYMQPLNAPVSEPRNYITAYDYNSTSELGITTTPLIQNGAVTDTKITSLTASKILASTIVVPVNIGTSGAGSVILDGTNNRIVVNDGTTNRIVIGNV